MKINELPYQTLHSLHDSKPISQCFDCQELKIKEQEANDAAIDQAIENKHHNHGDRN